MVSSAIVDLAPIVCTVCTPGVMPTVRRARLGVSFDPEIADILDRDAEALKELGVTRSEVVNAILEDFFACRNTSEAVWEAVSKSRVRRRGRS